MCEFLSFLTNKEGRVWVGDLHSHSGVAAGYGLKPGTYREAEWTGEEEKHLTVRTEDGERENEYRAAILALYPTRAALLKSITEGRVEGLEYQIVEGVVKDVQVAKEHWLNRATKEQVEEVFTVARRTLTKWKIPHTDSMITVLLTTSGKQTALTTLERWKKMEEKCAVMDLGVLKVIQRNPVIREILFGA